jgi:hypothetical protein
MHHARGSFTVKIAPLAATEPDGISRYSLEKELQGDVQGTSKGEMMGGGDVKAGSAGYVAVEVVRGTVSGKSGSFLLQHSGTMDAGAQSLEIIVVPGSATGELKGLRGKFIIRVENGTHFYDFDYTLPE